MIHKQVYEKQLFAILDKHKQLKRTLKLVWPSRHLCASNRKLSKSYFAKRFHLPLHTTDYRSFSVFVQPDV